MTTLSRTLLAAAFCLFSTLAFSADEKTPGSSEESTKLALEWLALIDDGNYAQSWDTAGERFKSMVTSERWVAAMQQSRQPLGRVQAREVAEASFTRELPRAPQGEYWIVTFKTGFEGVKANEVITLTPNADGTWHVIGYFIRPAQ